MSKRVRVQINYKSGISVVTECDELSVRRSVATGGIGQISGEAMDPRPLHFGVDQIESVWELS